MADSMDVRDAVVIERIVDAPIAFVWRLWTEPQLFEGWYGPEGAVVSVREMDVRTGGVRFVGMAVETPGGSRRLWFVGEHREVVAEKRLVYTESLADEHGAVLSPAEMGMPASHPETTEVIVEFEAIDGRTRVVLTHLGIPGDSPGAAGWRMAFDKLANVAAAR